MVHNSGLAAFAPVPAPAVVGDWKLGISLDMLQELQQQTWHI